MTLKDLILELPLGKLRWLVWALLGVLSFAGYAAKTMATTWKVAVDAVVSDYPKTKTETATGIQTLKDQQAQTQKIVERIDQRVYELVQRMPTNSKEKK